MTFANLAMGIYIREARLIDEPIDLSSAGIDLLLGRNTDRVLS